uniref:Uncharacterized protein n=1 Tax=viral metagenome TaxID=1070528 RepID=A0A6H2A251_9ZZZZ
MARPLSQGGIDGPDGGFFAGSGIYPVQSDLGELAVRLGAPASIDRLGNVIYMRDFRYGLNSSEWGSSGAGEDVHLSGNHSMYGGYTVRLEKVASTSSYSGVEVRTVARSAGRVGVETLFAVITNYPKAKLYLYRYTGTQLYRWGLQWDTANQEVSILTDVDTWTLTGTTVKCLIGYPLLHSMKLVGDESDGDYVRALIDGVEIDLPEGTAVISSSTVDPHLLLRVFNSAGPPYGCFMYVDAIMVTVNEPP